MLNKEKVALEIKDLEKHFGGIKAVNKVNMKLYKNEILAIVGDNGAGKSTLIKCINGAYIKDGGEIYIDGKLVNISNTMDAKKLGIETLYQDKGLVSTLDAPSNLFLGREKIRKNFLGKMFRFVDERYMQDETRGVMSKIGIELKNLTRPISVLSGGQQQSIGVGRALYWSAKILIFDEPTNNLGVKEQAKAIELIRNIRDTNKDISIIVISHNLDHVFELADRIMVLKNGCLLGVKEKNNTTHRDVVSMIAGVVVNTA